MNDPRLLSSSARGVAGVAPAKLNLFLELLGKRPDGYHELRTVFHAIDLADDVTVELRPAASGDSIECRGLPIDGPPEANLALRAVTAFRRHVGRCPPVHVTVVKRIPLGSGMGGGSSDAAFVLTALATLTGSEGVPVSPGLAAAAREVGADVGFFLVGGTALGCGRGDELTPIAPVAPATFLLALPSFSLSTATVYAHADLIGSRADVSSFVEGMRARARGKPITGCFNRLEAAAAQVEPRLPSLLAKLRGSTGISWSMTGSGSALFAPMSRAAEAETVARRVTGALPIDIRIVQSFGAPPANARTGSAAVDKGEELRWRSPRSG